MSLSLKSNSDGSGSIYIDGAEKIHISTSGVVTTHTPSGSYVMLTRQDTVLPIFGPVFSAHITSSTTTTAGVYTKINFATEDFDSDNCYENSRFTPNVPGYYLISGCVQFNTSPSVTSLLGIFKNGVLWSFGDFVTTAQLAAIRKVNSIVYLNGINDFVEIHAYTSSSTTPYLPNGVSTKFSGVMIRNS